MSARDPAPSFQDLYPDDVAHCYGCGRLNEHGLKLESRWDGERSIAIFTPRPHHTAIPGYVYGGLIASLVDCHGTGTAAAAAARAAGREIDDDPPSRYVTAALHVEYLRPTPIDAELVLRGTVVEIGPRKVVVDVTLDAAGETRATGRVVAVRMPDAMVARAAAARP